MMMGMRIVEDLPVVRDQGFELMLVSPRDPILVLDRDGLPVSGDHGDAFEDIDG